MAMAVFSKSGHPKRNLAVLIGSIIPDAFIYVAWIWLTFIKGESQSRIWDEIYFEEPMQLLASFFNSIPIYTALALIGYVMWRAKDRAGMGAYLLMFFCSRCFIAYRF